jgi:tripeptide aminopeptidase
LVDHDSLLETFLELVQIQGPSYDEAKVAEYAAQRLAALGAEVRRDDIGNVIGYLAGEGEPLLLNAHLDTVEPCRNVKVVRQGTLFRSDGTTILCADDRAGVAAILQSLATVVEAGTPHLPLEIVFTVREEVQLQGAKALDYSALRSKRCIALDSTGPVGDIITAAPAQDSLTATIIRRAAHAGIAPEDGVNAIVIAADAISRMPLGRIDFETTANIGVINGGRVTNIVPDRVEIAGEARSRNEAKLAEQTKAMVSLLEDAANRRGGRADTNVERVYPAYTVADDSHLVQYISDCMGSLGIPCRTAPTGGGSDVNIFNDRGITAVNLSAGYRNPHSTTEELEFSELAKASELLVALVTK